MTRSDRLLKNTIIYAIGNFGSRLLSFLLIPLYTFYLSKEDLGQYDLITTSVVLLIPFLSLQVSDATYRWLLDSDGNDRNISSAITNGLIVLMVTFTAFSALFLVLSSLFTIPFPGYSLSILIMTALFTFFQQAVRGLGNNKLYSTAGIIYTLLFLLLNVVFLLCTHFKVEGLLISTIIANAVSILVLTIRGKLFRRIQLSRFDVKKIKQMIAYSGPLIPNTISWWLINEVNRFIILYFLGLDANGIFALANRFPALLLVVNSIFMLAWQDHAISSHSASGNASESSVVFDTFMRLELTFAILLISITKPMMYWLVDDKFYPAWQYIPILYIAVVFSSFAAFLGVGYLNAKETKGIFHTTIWGSVVNILITLSTIRFIGLFAPTLGMAAGFLCMWIARMRQAKRFQPLQFDKRFFFFLLIMSVAFSIIVHTNSTFIQTALVVIAVFFLLHFNRALILLLTTKIRHIATVKRHHE